MKHSRSPDDRVSDSKRSPSPVQSSGSCLICDGSITRRSLVRHLKTCMNTHEREMTDHLSFLLHFSPVGLSRYYLVVLVQPEATFYDLDHLLKYVLKADEDRSSRFQFEEQYYFSHMNDGYPGMNFPIRSSPVLHEEFQYLLYGQAWYPTVIGGKFMGELPYAPKNGESVEVVAVNEVPEKYHIWPQRPR